MGSKARKYDLIDRSLLEMKVPAQILQAEKVTVKITGKKKKAKYLQSTKIKAAISNYRKAVTRFKRSQTLLEKHYKILSRIKQKL